MIGYCYKSKELGKRVLYLVRNMKSDAQQLLKDSKNAEKFPIKVRRIHEYGGEQQIRQMKSLESKDADVLICLMNPKSISKFEILRSLVLSLIYV